MGRRYLIAAALLLAAVAEAALPGGCDGTWVERDGVRLGCARTLNFSGTGFAPTCTAGECVVDLSTLVPTFGDAVGCTSNPSSVCDPFDLSGRTVDAGGATGLELPNSTTLPGTCTTAQVYIDTDATATLRHYICEAANTWVVQGNVVTSGRSGGQKVAGGTAASDNLTLNPNTATTAVTGRIGLCSDTPSYTATGQRCLTLFPDGLRWDAGTGHFLSGVVLEGTLTQVEDNFNTFSLLNADYTWQVTGTGVAFGSNNYLIRANLVYDNANSNSVAGGAMRGLDLTFGCSKSGSGSSFSTSTWETVKGGVGTIGTGCTVPDYYVGGHALGSGTVNGALTNWWGYVVDAPTIGTNRFQFGAGEHTITGTVPAGVGVWGIESGAPNRFYFKNESGHTWRMGYATWTVTLAALAADNTTRFAIPDGVAAAVDTTEANVDTFVAPGPLKIYAIACAFGAAPDNGAGTQTRTVTVRTGAAGSLSDSALVCSGASETTRDCTSRAESGVAVTTGQRVTLKFTAASTPAATTSAESTCTLWWNLDAF